MSRSAVVLLVMAAMLLACTATVVRAWSYDPSQNNLVCDATGAQGNPSLAYAGEGNYYVVWEDWRSGQSRAFGQRLDADGNRVWDPDGIPVCDTASVQMAAVALPGPEVSCYVVWTDIRAGSYRVMAQRIDPAGFYHWDPDGVAVCSDTAGQRGPEAVTDGAGGLVVVWDDDRGGSSTSHIYAQRIDPSGSPQWAPGGVPVCTDTADQSLSSIASDGEGGVLVAWMDNRAGEDSLDLYIQHVSYAGYRVWGTDGTPVCTAAGWQSGCGLVADGAGGAFVVWRDERAGQPDIYAQRHDDYGTALWGTDGIPVQATSFDEYSPSIVDDGDGGIIVTWLDGRASIYERDIYAQRLDRWGNLLWDSGGAPVCTYGDYMGAPELVSDGAGGVVAVWLDNRLGGGWTDIYAQRLDSDGTRLWDEDGVAVSTQSGPQENCAAVTDGAGGIISAWRLGKGEDETGDVYAQRLERNGYLGFPCPTITAVEDYPDDQGGMAVVSWNRSYLDQYPHQVITDYSLWRRMPDDPPERSTAEAMSLSLTVGLPLEVVENLTRSGWAYVGNVAASYWPDYGYDAPTYGDSTAAGTPVTEYMAVAQTADQWVFWESTPLAGYSVDNVAPGAPLALAAASQQTDVDLTWSPSGLDDEDLDFYNVYRSDVAGFAPGPATFVETAADTVYTDVEPGGGTWYYRVTAEDVHGNEGDPSNEASAETWAGVEEMPMQYSLRGCHPNPFNPVTTIAFDVPEPGGKVTLEIFDVRGRLVRTLASGLETPGHKGSPWFGENDAGRVLPSGVYFLKMTAADYEETVKVTLLK